MRKLYYKNKLLVKITKPFENKRLFNVLKLNIFTLKQYQFWPKKLIALDAFCQTGLQWSRIFSDEAEYLEMWDIEPQAVKYAKKEFPQAIVMCGNSIDAIVNCKFGRKDFNFVILDTPVPYQYVDGSFEHFSFFEYLFNNIANDAVIIMNVISDISPILSKHPHSTEFIDNWIKARGFFYNVNNGSLILPHIMIEIYREKVKKLGFDVNLITYNARNELVGMLTLVVSKS